MAIIKIENDLFDLNNRIKEIDEGYFIAFNTKTKNFEVHNSFQPYSTFCLLVPKNKLNAALLEYVRKTRSSRQKKLLEEMEKSNAKLEKEGRTKIIEEAAEKFEELSKNVRS